ncbi:MAG: DUF58 domain-containing protein, partial [candidate division WOR-3 bacterium]
AIVFLISDLLGPGFSPERIEKPLGVVSKKHDLIVIGINDPAENRLPSLGFLEFEDAETGRQVLVNTLSSRTRRFLEERQKARKTELMQLFQRFGIDFIPLETGEEFTPKLHRFFQERARRFR